MSILKLINMYIIRRIIIWSIVLIGLLVIFAMCSFALLYVAHAL